MDESDVVLTMNSQKKQASTVKSWRKKFWVHLASKENKAGLHGKAQSRVHHEAGSGVQ